VNLFEKLADGGRDGIDGSCCGFARECLELDEPTERTGIMRQL
jgi:hypothetical protein